MDSLEYSPEIEALTTWRAYAEQLTDWQELVKNVVPKQTPYGQIYEPANPLGRPNESFAIADMRQIKLAETAHFTIPKENLVMIVINTPPFTPENCINLNISDPRVGFDEEQLKRLVSS